MNSATYELSVFLQNISSPALENATYYTVLLSAGNFIRLYRHQINIVITKKMPNFIELHLIPINFGYKAEPSWAVD